MAPGIEMALLLRRAARPRLRAVRGLLALVVRWVLAMVELEEGLLFLSCLSASSSAPAMPTLADASSSLELQPLVDSVVDPVLL